MVKKSLNILHVSHQTSPVGGYVSLICLLAVLLILGLGGCKLQKPEILKLHIQEEGIYEIGWKELAQAGLIDNPRDLSKISLFAAGSELPAWIEMDNQKGNIRFFAQASQSDYTIQNVYWLAASKEGKSILQSWKRESCLSEQDLSKINRGDFEASRETYSRSSVIEENKLYNPQVEEGDRWLWKYILAPQEFSININLSALSTGPARLRTMVWASTEAPGSSDHHWIVSLNDRVIVDETWDGKGRHLVTGEIPSGIFKEGSNQVKIASPGDTGILADITYLDWLAIEYPRQLVAENDRLFFISQGGEHYLQGFSGLISVYDITEPKTAALTARLDPSDGVFEGQAGHRYWAVGLRGFLKPSRIEPVTAHLELRSSYDGADYLAIGPLALLKPLQPLLDYRQSQGYQTLAVPVEDIYDQFSGGLPEPEALRAYLSYVTNSWRLTPRYLLLVGDATYDPKAYLAPPEANQLPTFLVDTVFGGQTASDLGFSQVDNAISANGTIPAEMGNYADRACTPIESGLGARDLAIGRIPARTPGQVNALVEKTLAYEHMLDEKEPSTIYDTSEWQRKVLAIADGQAPEFRLDAQDFLQLFPDAYRVELLSPRAGDESASAQIKSRITDGVGLLAYFGHGSVDMWGKDSLLTVKDIGNLRNKNRSLVVLNFTCLTGLFTHPTTESLSEAFLWQPDGGAVAVLAPSSLTLPADQSFLSHALVEAIREHPGEPLGELVRLARKQVPRTAAGARDVFLTYNLFGDPALRMPVVNQ